MTLIVGLTGSIACGKSTVSAMFLRLGIPVIDADKIAHVVMNPGEKAYEGIVELFGDAILREDGYINRPSLGKIVFSDEEKRKQLNQIVHPAVRKKIAEQRDMHIEMNTACVVLDIPLLFESNLMHLVDKTLVVYVDEGVQLERLMNRNNLTEAQAHERIQSQYPVKEKAKMADAVIDNNGPVARSEEQLREILTSWEVDF